jgi:hypothetical protein
VTACGGASQDDDPGCGKREEHPPRFRSEAWSRPILGEGAVIAKFSRIISRRKARAAPCAGECQGAGHSQKPLNSTPSEENTRQGD